MLGQERIMTSAGPAIMGPTSVQTAEETETLTTRFGKVVLYRKHPIVFPSGMLGMPDKFQFCLCSLQGEKLGRFKLLQSLEVDALSFLTLPVACDNPYIDRADIEQACADLDVPIADVVILLIVSVQRVAAGVQLSVNTRAPVLVHMVRNLGAQYVLHNPKYQIRQPV